MRRRLAFVGDAFDIAAVAECGQRICGKIAGLAPLAYERADVGPEGGAEGLFGFDQSAGVLQFGEAVPVDEGGAGIELLRGDDRLDHGFEFALEVVALVDHEGDGGARVIADGEDFVENAEELVGVDGAQGEVVVGVLAVVEVESAECVCGEQPGDDLLDVGALVVVAGVDEDLGLRTGAAGELKRHAPVGDIGVVEGGLEGLVLDQHALCRA